MTELTERSRRNWRGESRIAIGRALLRLGPGPVSAAELAKASGSDRSNCKRLADELVGADLLKRVPPPSRERRPGRRTTSAYIFAEGEQERFANEFGDDAEPGALRDSQQLVFIDVAHLADRHFSRLASPQVLANASWSALLDGERQELVIAFDGENAVDASLDLLALLSTAELRASRAAVTKVDSLVDLRRWIHRGRDLDGPG
jgi:hypothetical protein